MPRTVVSKDSGSLAYRNILANLHSALASFTSPSQNDVGEPARYKKKSHDVHSMYSLATLVLIKMNAQGGVGSPNCIHELNVSLNMTCKIYQP